MERGFFTYLPSYLCITIESNHRHISANDALYDFYFFTAPIPQGAEVRLMISDIERGLEIAELAARGALEKLGGKKPKAAIIVNSVARKKMLGIRADEEIEVIQRVIGRDVPMVGFYSYAQIGGKIGEETPFHNGSLLVWLLAE